MRVCIGDHGDHAVERGHGVQPLGQQPEPLLRHRVLTEEALRAMLDPPSGDDAPLCGEVAALGVRPQAAQVVRHGVHKTPIGQLPQSVAQGGGGNAAEAGHLVHGGQGRGARQQERVLKTQGQADGTGRRFLGRGVIGQPPLRRLPKTRPGNQRLPGRFHFLDAAAHAVHDRAWNDPPRVTPRHEPPQGVAGDAEDPGRTVAPVPHRIGPHVGTDRPLKVSSGLCRGVDF